MLVNTNIPRRVYLPPMPKPGPKKGERRFPRRTVPTGFGDRLRTTIERSIYSISELERLSEVSRQTIYSYMRDDKPTVDALALFALARALRVDAEWLLFGDQRKKETGVSEKAREKDLV